MRVYESPNYLVTLCSADSSGIVQLQKVRKSTFSYGLEKSPLFNKTQGVIYQMERMQIRMTRSSPNQFLEAIGMVNAEQAMVVVVEPFVDIVFKRVYRATSPKMSRLQLAWRGMSDWPPSGDFH